MDNTDNKDCRQCLFQLAKYVRSFKDEISKLLPTEASTCDVEKKVVNIWTDNAEMSPEELVLKKRKAKGRQAEGLSARPMM